MNNVAVVKDMDSPLLVETHIGQNRVGVRGYSVRTVRRTRSEDAEPPTIPEVDAE